MMLQTQRLGRLAVVALCFSAAPALAQLSNAAFEPPYATADLQVYGAASVDAWGTTGGSIVGTTLGIVPADGVQMLQLDPVVAPQAYVSQIVGVEHLSSVVDAGLLVADRFIACFANPTVNSQAVSGRMFLNFIDAGGVVFGGSSVLVTSTPNTGAWTPYTLFNQPVPSGTRRVEAVMCFDTVTMASSVGGSPIFVDKMFLGFEQVPEPAAASLLALGFAGFARRRRS
ncbi:MAG: PEP-CTERM sorting domain-containing protein [Lacipirellulaceae bacterium]